MVVGIYNTLARKVQVFKPIEKDKVKIYTCGPTVYDYAHIGNFRAFVFADLLKRFLKFKGFEVFHVSNITDVDDKTIKNSQKEGLSLKGFTEKYTKIFLEDLKKLNIQTADVYPRATAHINEMIVLIEELMKKGFAYQTDDNSVYFAVKKFKDYGEFANLDMENLKAGASGRVLNDEYEKESLNDFALWKSYSTADGDVFWDSPWGKGRPGWHIECSAMSMKYLGETFDIHTGGVDLVFPHHQNEIAQSEASTGKTFAKYWMHNEHLLVDNAKMSKSLGNMYTLKDIEARKFSFNALRYALLATHYRQKMNFTFNSLGASKNAIERIVGFKINLKSAHSSEPEGIKRLIEKMLFDFEEALDNDLDTSKALASLFAFIKEVNILLAAKKVSSTDAAYALSAIDRVDSVLGILPLYEPSAPDEVLSLMKERDLARKNKDWKKSDELRNKIKEYGYIVEDLADGQRCKKLA